MKRVLERPENGIFESSLSGNLYSKAVTGSCWPFLNGDFVKIPLWESIGDLLCAVVSVATFWMKIHDRVSLTKHSGMRPVREALLHLETGCATIRIFKMLSEFFNSSSEGSHRFIDMNTFEYIQIESKYFTLIQPITDNH